MKETMEDLERRVALANPGAATTATMGDGYKNIHHAPSDSPADWTGAGIYALEDCNMFKGNKPTSLSLFGLFVLSCYLNFED